MSVATTISFRQPKTMARLAVAFLMTIASVGVLLSTPVVAKAAAVGPNFPRLAIWWPNSDTQSAADRARTDWIAMQNYDAHHIAELRAINPSIVILGSTSAREVNYNFDDYNNPVNVELRSVSTDWMLTQVGSTLTSNITASATSIPVADVTKFAVGEMVLVDHELMNITAIGSTSLTVRARGGVNPAAAHTSGARIASVVSVWPGSITMDLTTNCPKADVGNGPETWSEWNIRRGRAILDSAAWDGLLIDCFESNASWMVSTGKNRSIDQARTNRAVTDGYAAFNSAWNTGSIGYGNGLRAAVGTKMLIGNGNMRNFNMNGNIFEEFPYASLSASTWNLLFVGPYSAPHASYPEWMAGVTGKNLTMVQTYGGHTDYKLMRFGLTSTLMNDGYFSYALSSSGHARNGIDWFDEYDNAGAGRGYLGQPTGAAYKAGNAWRRDYDGGIVLVNPTTSAVTVSLGGSYRKIAGTQDRTVNDGTTVSSVTIQGHDGIILLKIAAPVLPPMPSGTMSILEDRVTSPEVTIRSSVTGATEMRVDAGAGLFGAWAAYASSKQVSLTGSYGSNLVRVEYRNAAGTIQLIDTVDYVEPAPVVEPAPPTDPVLPTDPTTPTAPVVPTDPTTATVPVSPAVTLRATSTLLDYGTSTTLWIATTDVPSAMVRVESRTATSPNWVAIATMLTDASGAAQLTVTPLVTTDYRTVLVDAGVDSNVVSVAVKAAATVKSSKSRISRKTRVTMSGTVTSALSSLVSVASFDAADVPAAGPTVRAVLQRKVGHRWIYIKRVYADETAKYSVRVRPRVRGTYNYRIRVESTDLNAAGVSRTVTIRVR